jgi:hypothetical protein
MKFVLFVEGHTEKKAVPRFLKKWLDPQVGYAKCPRLRELLDEMLRLARESAG